MPVTLTFWCLAAAAGMLRWATPPGLSWRPSTVAAGVTQPDPMSALVAAFAAAAWLMLGVLGFGLVAALAGRLPGAMGALCGRVADVVTPRIVRRAVDIALGATLVAGVAAPPALADAPPPRPPTTSLVGGVVDGLSLDRPAGSAVQHSAHSALDLDRPAPLSDRATPADPVRSRARATPPVDRPTVPAVARRDGPVVVRPGDTLWAIAARHLASHRPDHAPPAASDVAREWPRWYAANRTVIGPDPDLILPGQRLQPPPDTSRRSHADDPDR